jgi:hypothetical protein
LHAAGVAEEEQGALFLIVREGAPISPRVPIHGPIREHQAEDELRDRLAHVVERDPAIPHLREHPGEELAVERDVVQATEHFRPDVVVAAGEVETRHLDALGERNERLGGEEVREVREGEAFGRRELQPGRIVERVVGQGGKPGVPHEARVEGRVGDERAALVPQAGPIRPHDVVVLDADRDGLGVAEPGGGRVRSDGSVGRRYNR